MNAALFESRPLYGIGTIARLTGLKPDTLRVWERRYGLGASHKSDTGRRQYTQSDLEHLQLISALVADGARIGEIASAERKTLAMLIQQRGLDQRAKLPKEKARAVFIGTDLCEWLDDHQGCISNVDARLARTDLATIDDETLDELDESRVAVLECMSLGSVQVERLRALGPKLGHLVVVYQFGNERWLGELERLGVRAMSFPPDPGELAFEIARAVAEADATQGDHNLGDLAGGKPRRFGVRELAAAAKIKNVLECECPRHIADLITALSAFEDYATSCSVHNWQDAAVHARIFTYTSQARHLMEKALEAALEERADEYRDALARLRGGLSDAA